MKTVVLMVVTLLNTTEGDYGFVVPYQDRDMCETAVPHMYTAVAGQWPNADVKCKSTGQILTSPYPKPRPDAF